MESLYVILGVVVVLALVFLGNLATVMADEKRITKDVELNGGRVTSIEAATSSSVWSSRRDRPYTVCYSTGSGEQFRADCRTSSQNGVYWVRDVPPGLLPGNYAAARNAGLLQDSMTCPVCGANVPRDRKRCSKCGWTFKGIVD